MITTRLVFTILCLIGAATSLGSSSFGGALGGAGGQSLVRVPLGMSISSLVEVPSNAIEPLTEIEAREANLRAPFSLAQIEPALPLSLPIGTESFAARASAADCLTAAIYYEAATEAEVGKRAVAQVVLNRVRHPAFPNSVCEVVMQGSNRATGCQFTFSCDGSLYRAPSLHGWQSARQIALAALSGAVEPSVGMATHYHANYVRPYWASSLDKITAIGSHIFYRWSGGWGKRRAFDQALTLGRDYDIHQAIEWKSASRYLYDVGQSGSEQAISLSANQQEPLQSDDVLPLAPVQPQILSKTVARLQADRVRGTLVADESDGVLMVN